jgi:hypothetical protein
MADPYRTAALRAGRRPNLYIPEENQEWQEGQKLIGPEAAWRRNYEFVLQQTGDPQRAEALANSIARTERRQELTQLATSVAGPIMRGGELATGLARTVMGGSRATEAPAAMRALPPPRRNAMYPDEMLTPDVIPMGGPSFNTPRLTYAKPETRYRLAVDRPAPGRPLTNYDRPAIDTTFVRPEDVRPFNAGNVRGTVDPLDVLAAEGGQSSEAVALAQRLARQKAEGRAATVANEEARFAGGEGPNYAEEVLNRRRLAAEQQARAAEQEIRFQSGQVDAMANEGGGAGRQAMENELNRAARADFEARQLSTLGDEAGAITSGRNPPNRVARALQLTERQPPAAPPEFVGPPEMQGPRQITPGNFIGPAERQGPPELIGPRQTPQIPLLEQLQSGQISGREYQAALNAQRSQQVTPNTFIGPAERQGPPELIGPRQARPAAPVDPVQEAINAAKQRADAMARGNADAIAQQAAIDAAAQRAGTGSGPMFPGYKPYSPPSMTVPLVGAGAIGAGALALNSGKQGAMDAVAGADEAAQQAAIDAMRGRDEFNQAAPNTFNQQEAIRIASTRPEFNQSWSNQAPVRPAASTAAAVRNQQAAPTPMMRLESSPSPKDSILSRIFSGQDYQSSGPTRGDNRLYQGEKDGRKVINWGDPESAADFFRASKAQQDWNAQSPDSPSIGAGMKRGGAAGKPDSVHKALEIIHHLLTRSH